jgi:hypothetical protein
MARMTAKKPGVRAARAAELVARYDAGDYDAIRFLRVGNDVHVVTTRDNRTATRIAKLLGETGDQAAMWKLASGETWTVCGDRYMRHRDGFESAAQLVGHFPDELLCYECHKAFGDRGEVIFEVNQDDGSDPTQIGRLADDVVTGGGALQ